MKRLLAFGMILLAGLLNGCGSDNSLADGPDNQGTDAAAAIIELILSNTQLGTALTALPVTITAQVKDASNAVVPGALVAFSASSGSITITQATTDASGIALAELRNGSDPSNRIITVTVTSGGASATVDVLVTGTSLSFVSGPGSLPQGDTEEYIVALTDSDNNAISGQTVSVSQPTSVMPSTSGW